MSNYESHAWREFRAAGWVDQNNKFNDEMQQEICENVIELIKVFSSHNNSGSSAPYALNVFDTLARFNPIAPLTGEDWEWHDVSDYGGRENGPLYQNKRCGRVFKDDTGAYDTEGIVWYDWYTDEETGEKRKSHFTNYKSRVPVTFPYSPKTEYKERIEE